MNDPIRVLGLGRGLALSLGAVVGSGIFILPAYVSSLLADPLHAALIWLLGGALAFCTALSYAEMATVFPHSGGYVVYLREIFGRRTAFIYGWAALLVIYPSSLGGLARVFGRSMLDLFPQGPPVALWALLLVVAAAFLNVAGVEMSSRSQSALSTIKVLALFLLALAGLWWMRSPEASPAGPWLVSSANAWPGLRAIFLALVAVLWCFEGFLEIVVVAGVVRQPSRNLIRILGLSVILVTVLYLLFVLALQHQLGPEMAGSEAVAADLARRLWGEPGGRVISALVALCTGSAVLAFLFSFPRILVALADAGLFYRNAGRLWPRTGTPAVAILLAGLLMAMYATIGTFEQLVQYFALFTGIFSSLILVGGIKLRRDGGVAMQNRRIPLWPLPPLLAIAASIGGMIYVLMNQPRSSLAGLLLLLVAIPLSRRFVGAQAD